MDDLASDLNLDRIDFLKLEAEGAEIEAIDGMESCLLQKLRSMPGQSGMVKVPPRN
ncbi:MAG: FkbM family methyltransferase [Pelagimonas sp.]